MLKVKPATSVLKIIRAYCEAKGLERHSLRFLFDGDRIPEGATVASLGLEQGDWYEYCTVAHHMGTAISFRNAGMRVCAYSCCPTVLMHSFSKLVEEARDRGCCPHMALH